MRIWTWLILVLMLVCACQSPNPFDGKDGALHEPDASVTDDGGLDADGAGNSEGDEASADNASDQDSFRRERSCTTIFTYAPQGAVSEVLLAGEWDWNTKEPMQQSGGVYQIEKNLAAGLYCYKFVVNGNWIMDPGNPYQAYCEGTANSGIRVPDCTSPLLSIDGAPIKGQNQFQARVLYHAGFNGSGPKTFTATMVNQFVSTPIDSAWNRGDWSLDVSTSGLTPGKYTLRFEATDNNGKAAEPLLLPFWIEENAFDWRDALIYMVVTDRFVNGNAANDPGPTPDAYGPADWKGGDFSGVTQKIESGTFDALGVRALWLTPFNSNALDAYPDRDGQHMVTGYHGYWPIKPREVDPRLGTAEDLQRMVAAAHGRGIRVLMDLVVNHVHEEHTYFKEHPDWFNNGCICGTPGCDWTEQRLTCLFADYLPDIDWTHKVGSEQFISDALWWMETFDLDGARVDAVKHVNDSCIFNLASRVREKFEGAGTRYYLDGETAMGWSGDNVQDNAVQYGTINNYMGPWGLNGQFDFVLYHAVVRNVFVYGVKGYLHLDFWTGVSQSQYTAGSIMTPFIGSHDTSRLVTLADYRGQDSSHALEIADHKWMEQGLPVQPSEDEPYQRALTAFCWLLTIPGAPMIYMGDEYGDYGGGDPDNRHVYRQAANLSAREAGLLQKVGAIGRARQTVVALRRGAYQSLGSTETMMLFSRKLPGGETAVVAINGSNSVNSATVDVNGLGFSSGQIADQLGFGGQMQVQGSSADITVSPRSCSVFVP